MSEDTIKKFIITTYGVMPTMYWMGGAWTLLYKEARLLSQVQVDAFINFQNHLTIPRAYRVRMIEEEHRKDFKE